MTDQVAPTIAASSNGQVDGGAQTAYQLLGHLWPVDFPGWLPLCHRPDGGKFSCVGTYPISREGLWAMAQRSVELAAVGDTWFGVGGLSGQPPGGRKGEEKDVRFITSLWADVDKLDDPIGFLTGLGDWQPSLIVRTGNGVHAYWLLDQAVDFAAGDDPKQTPEARLAHIETARYLHKLLVWRFHAWLIRRAGGKIDDVTNLDRVLRLPGTTNRKGEPKPVELLGGTGRRFSLDAIKAMLDAEAVQVEDAKLRKMPGERKLAQLSKQGTATDAEAEGVIGRLLPKYVQWALDEHDFGGGKVGHDWTGYFLAQQLNDHYVPRQAAYDALGRFGEEIAAKDTKRYDPNRPLDADWARTKVDSAFKLAPRGPAKPASTVGGNAAEAPVYDEVEPWPDEVEGAALLDELVEFYAGPLVLPEGGADVCALYTVVTYIVDLLELCPYLSPSSAVMRAGKTRLTTLLSFVVNRPLLTSNASPSAIFRECERSQPTLLIDEGDTFINVSEELRGILNTGYDRNLFVLRSIPQGREYVAARFSAFGPKVIALIGALPPTVADRTIVLEMKRKKSDEDVTKFRRVQRRDLREHGRELARKIARWVHDHHDALDKSEPALPVELDDRAADNWEPLLMIADAAGEAWGVKARKVALALSIDRDRLQEGMMLLADARQLFDENRAYVAVDRAGRERHLSGRYLTPTELTHRLWGLEERPWASYGGRENPITTDAVGKLLGGFGISSKKTRVRDDPGPPLRLYWPELFEDAWARHGIAAGEGDVWTLTP